METHEFNFKVLTPQAESVALAFEYVEETNVVEIQRILDPSELFGIPIILDYPKQIDNSNAIRLNMAYEDRIVSIFVQSPEAVGQRMMCDHGACRNVSTCEVSDLIELVNSTKMYVKTNDAVCQHRIWLAEQVGRYWMQLWWPEDALRFGLQVRVDNGVTHVYVGETALPYIFHTITEYWIEFDYYLLKKREAICQFIARRGIHVGDNSSTIAANTTRARGSYATSELPESELIRRRLVTLAALAESEYLWKRLNNANGVESEKLVVQNLFHRHYKSLEIYARIASQKNVMTIEIYQNIIRVLLLNTKSLNRHPWMRNNQYAILGALINQKTYSTIFVTLIQSVRYENVDLNANRESLDSLVMGNSRRGRNNKGSDLSQLIEAVNEMINTWKGVMNRNQGSRNTIMAGESEVIDEMQVNDELCVVSEKVQEFQLHLQQAYYDSRTTY